MIRIDLFDQSTGARKALPRWAAWLATASGLAIGVALFLLAASLLLILLPIVAIIGGIAAWRLRRKLKTARFSEAGPFAHRKNPRAGVVDVEYRIIEPDRRKG